MHYKHPNFGELKVFELVPDFNNRVTLQEYSNGSPKSSMSLTSKEAEAFKTKLTENGWHAV